MPLSECIPALRAGQSLRNKPMSDLLSALPNADLVEFQWGDGQIFMQDQQSKHRKTASSFDVDDDVDVDGIASQQEPEDDLVTWLNYTSNTTNDYGLEFLSESTSPGSHKKPEDNSVFPPKTFAPASGTDVSTAPSSDHCRTQMGLQWTGLVSDSKSTNPTWEFPDSKLQMEVQISPPPTRGGSGLVNFSHFARPVSRLKPGLQNVDRMTSNEKASTTAPSNSPAEPPPSGDPNSILLQEQLPPVEPQTNQVLDGSNNNNNKQKKKKKKSKNPPTTNLPRQEDLENSSDLFPTMEPSSSSSNHKYRFKRKTHEEAAAAESGYQSVDVDDHEPTVAKKTAVDRGASNPKRSRAAEVHNLSERRRRDRINEKMRALQELIPNCNKTDKASMLDEAIEYLKALQFQVQIMSMSGGGLCMPPAMTLPQAMQHPQMTHLSPMGFGMGMGMGMFDMNAAPVFQMPASIPGTPKFRCSNPGVPMTANSVGFPIFAHPSMSVNNVPSFAPLPAPIAGLNNCPINTNSEIGGSNILQKENPATVATENGGRDP